VLLVVAGPIATKHLVDQDLIVEDGGGEVVAAALEGDAEAGRGRRASAP
jgi:hypothetical protein